VRIHDKISMDIVAPLPTIESGYSYILTIQDLLTKYSAVPLMQAISSEITAHRKVYQRIYRTKIMDYRSGLEFFKQHNASYNIKYLCIEPQYTTQSNGSIERSHHINGIFGHNSHKITSGTNM